MKFSKYIERAFRDAGEGDFEHALMEVCIAVDAVARQLYPNEKLVGKRYTQTIRDYYWLIEPTSGMGTNLIETKFTNVKLKKINDPDFADIVYENFRCALAHADDPPENFDLTINKESGKTEMSGGIGYVSFPDRIVWALIFLCVLTKVSKGENLDRRFILSLGEERWNVDDMWGKEEWFKQIAERYNQTRIKYVFPEGMRPK